MADEGEEKKVGEKPEEVSEEVEEKLPFPTARVVKIIKDNLEKQHQIKSDVKISANELLGRVLADIAKEMDKEEYFTLSIEHFNKAVRKYRKLELTEKRLEHIKKALEAERERINALIAEVDYSQATD